MTGRRLPRRRALRRGAAVFVAGTAAVAGCAGGPPDSRTVAMTADLAFDPETARVAAGGTVRWENDSEVGHTVTAYADELPAGAAYFASGGFASERAARNDVRSGLVAAGETYEHTFAETGTYGYFCVPHEGSGMVGTVRVG